VGFKVTLLRDSHNCNKNVTTQRNKVLFTRHFCIYEFAITRNYVTVTRIKVVRYEVVKVTITRYESQLKDKGLVSQTWLRLSQD